MTTMTSRAVLRQAAGTSSARTTGTWLLAIAAATLAGTLFAGLAGSEPAPGEGLHIPWWALIVAFCLAEVLVVHIHFRREAHTLSARTLPLVLGLLALSPLGLVSAQLVGTGAALVGLRRQRPAKIAFGISQAGLEATLAVIVFRSIIDGGDPFSPGGWAAGFTAAAVASLAGLLVATASVALADGRFVLRRQLSAAGVSFFGALTAASFALVAVTLARSRPEALVLLLLPVTACGLAMHAYASERRRHEHVESLHDSIGGADLSSEPTSGVQQLLQSARRLLRAEYAELVLLPGTTREGALRSSIGLGGEHLLEESELTSDERLALEAVRLRGGLATRAKDRHVPPLEPYLAERGLRDMIVASLEGEGGVLGILVVGDRASDLSTFDDEDERLVRTFAGHAALLLENEQLGRSLAKLTELEATLRHQAMHDALTGLPNRRYFRTRVEDALRRTRPGSERPAALFLDLDGFKAINDRLGHAAGDELLVAVGERIRANVRPDEVPSRLGGDEFAVLIEAGERAAEDVADRLIEAIRRPFSIDGRRLSVGVSVGIAPAGATTDVDELLTSADVAMYAAKGESSSSYAVYSERMRGAATARRRLGEAVERALERDQIAVHYQPVVNLRSGATVAFEALARWEKSESETVAAADFLPAAEEHDLIGRIDRVVLRAACVETHAWQTELEGSGGLDVCVNLSEAALADPKLSVEVATALLESGLEGRHLVLEIPEPVAMRDVESTRATMTELRRLGVRFALDAFGSSRSSVEQLSELPFDRIKIARQLVGRFGTGKRDERVIRAIVSLANTLGLEIVAEGIERHEQAVRFRELGCHFGQGFYFDEPLGVSDVRSRLGETPPSHLRLVVS